MLLQIKELNDAYAVLKDPTKRKIYDHWGSYGLEAAKKFGDDVSEPMLKFQIQ